VSDEPIDVMDTCGDCCTGRCHWGGELSRRGVAAVEADALADPRPCGCDRHKVSYRYRVQQLGEHFAGCHPADGEAPGNPEGYQPQPVEPCWHCGTSTTRGTCYCPHCRDESDDDIPQSAIYHCQLCRRWWAHMYLNVTKITFPGLPE